MNNDSSVKISRKNINVMILGSCVSRDIFAAYPERTNVVDYFARTSIRSLNSNPLFVNEQEIKLPSPFQKKMVMRDMNKTFWERIGIQDYGYLLIDFIDERFDFIRFNDLIITKSPELVNSGFLECHPQAQIISKNAYGIQNWREDLGVFISKLKGKIDLDKVAVLEAYWATSYIDLDQSVKEFGGNFGISKANSALESYYSALRDSYPEIRILPTPVPSASKNHKWGLAPYHFVDDWYFSCKKIIMDFVDQDMSKNMENHLSSNIIPDTSMK